MVRLQSFGRREPGGSPGRGSGAPDDDEGSEGGMDFNSPMEEGLRKVGYLPHGQGRHQKHGFAKNQSQASHTFGNSHSKDIDRKLRNIGPPRLLSIGVKAPPSEPAALSRPLTLHALKANRNKLYEVLCVSDDPESSAASGMERVRSPSGGFFESVEQQVKDYCAMAREYRQFQVYRNLGGNHPCVMCYKSPCSDTFFPCQHFCVCSRYGWAPGGLVLGLADCRLLLQLHYKSKLWRHLHKGKLSRLSQRTHSAVATQPLGYQGSWSTCPICCTEIKRIIRHDGGREVSSS
jgi:hypothetical protein